MNFCYIRQTVCGGSRLSLAISNFAPSCTHLCRLSFNQYSESVFDSFPNGPLIFG